MASAIPSTEKDPEYYGLARLDVLRFLEPPLGRVLDVGCGAGGNAKALRERGATEIVGIEIHEPSAEKAREVFDIVLAGAVEDQLDNLTGTFDTILNYDVLEHLADPHSVVKRLRDIAAPNARLHVSLPNARHWSLMRDLVVRGSFGYTKSGHRDSTHLQWFTVADASRMLEDAGWHVERVDHQELHQVSKLAERITRGLTAEFLVYQWAILARAV
jgi:2-polyprenyl-3-methyl-5-hydroxy-6-metoxy-1,4-benzoquinol methylase